MLKDGLGLDCFATCFLDKFFHLLRMNHQEIIRETLSICRNLLLMSINDQDNLTVSPLPPLWGLPPSLTNVKKYVSKA